MDSCIPKLDVKNVSVRARIDTQSEIAIAPALFLTFHH